MDTRALTADGATEFLFVLGVPRFVGAVNRHQSRRHSLETRMLTNKNIVITGAGWHRWALAC